MLKTQNKHIKYGGVLLLLCSMLMLGYFLPQDNFSQQIGFFAIGYAGFWICLKSDFSNIFLIGLLLRLALIASTPLLSDDYIRFLWDGYLTTEGINPFNFKPSELHFLAQENDFANSLFEHLTSKNSYSTYTPVNQWIFYFSASTHSILGGIISLRIVLIGFEIATYFVLKQILQRYQINEKKLIFYWLNPLVILELTGNLNTEGIFLFFLITALLSLSKMQDLKGGLLLSLSFCSNILSVIFLPLILLKGGKYRCYKLLLGFLPLSIFAFFPFLDSNNLYGYYQNLIESFQNDAFNASLFTIKDWFNFQILGFEGNQVYEQVLFLCSILMILGISWRFRYRNRKVLFTGITLIISTFFFLSPSVYPSYVIIPLTLSLFTRLTFPLIWSGLVFLSYSYYDNSIPTILKSGLLFTEYILVFVFLYRDLKSPIKK